MKYIFIILILIVVYFLIEVSIFYYKYTHLPTLVENKQTDQVLGSGKKLRYIAIGDSTAVGLGASSVENTYTYKIAKELSKNHEVYYKNIGLVGAKTEDVLNSQLQQSIDFKPDVVTISIGGNDATHLVSSKKVLNNLHEITVRLAKETTANVYLTNTPNFSWAKVLPWFYRRLLEYRDGSLNKQIQMMEMLSNSNGLKIVNIHDFGWSTFPDLSLTNAADSFHPNDLGYQNWNNAFLDKINPDFMIK